MQYDRDNWDFDLKEVCEKLGLDLLGRIRLINLIRNAVSINYTTFVQNHFFPKKGKEKKKRNQKLIGAICIGLGQGSNLCARG